MTHSFPSPSSSHPHPLLILILIPPYAHVGCVGGRGGRGVCVGQGVFGIAAPPCGGDGMGDEMGWKDRWMGWDGGGDQGREKAKGGEGAKGAEGAEGGLGGEGGDTKS